MTQQKPPFDGQTLLNAFRDMNATAREGLQHETCSEYQDAVRNMSSAAAHAAQAAEDALQELEAGYPTRARQYLDRMAHVMGMMSLDTYDPDDAASVIAPAKAELNWEATIRVEEHWPEDSDLRLHGIAWENALYYDGPDFEESLDGGIYHQRFAGRFLVGIRFTFHLAEDGTITATGIVHPAEDHRVDYYTETDHTLLTATLHIDMTSEETARHLRQLIMSRNQATGE